MIGIYLIDIASQTCIVCLSTNFYLASFLGTIPNYYYRTRGGVLSHVLPGGGGRAGAFRANFGQVHVVRTAEYAYA
jgi:hypothetical protein